LVRIRIVSPLPTPNTQPTFLGTPQAEWTIGKDARKLAKQLDPYAGDPREAVFVFFDEPFDQVYSDKSSVKRVRFADVDVTEINDMLAEWRVESQQLPLSD
jgi:hypothetical protein